MKILRILVAVAMLMVGAGEALALTTTLSPSDPLYNPANSLANYGVDLSGVAKLTINGGTTCSGALLSGSQYILTAAHCLTNTSGVLNVSSLSAMLINGGETIGGMQYYVAPGWTGSLAGGNDLAIVKLASMSTATGYSIYRDENVYGASGVVLAGYGRSGTGTQGSGALPSGTLRVGLNDFDGYWADPGNPFAYDFDNGTAAMNTIEFSTVDGYGWGNAEVMIAPGDSGGPSFINGSLFGVHSFITRLYTDYDTTANNSTFGELGGDTRVAYLASWIDSIVPVPQASALLLLASALTTLAALRRR